MVEETKGAELQLDLRGLICPEPVLRAKKALDTPAVTRIKALVDGEVNVNNLQRLSRSLKADFESERQADHYIVEISRDNSSAGGGSVSTSTKSSTGFQPKEAGTVGGADGSLPVGTVIFISKDKFGDGDADFSRHLLDLFLQTVLQSGHKPRAILMANSGVKLMNSTLRTVLDQFKAEGCDVLACGLCVDFYGLKEKIPVEQVTNMFAISEFLFSADKVLTP